MTHRLQLVLRPQSLEILDCADPQPTRGLIGVGQATLTTRFFEGDVISPGRLEQAIEWTEDQIQTASTNFPVGAQLVTGEDDLRELALVSGVSPSAHMVLHVEAVEATFSRLVMQAFGQAPHQEALPTSARFFATVVFIRELMHHLHFPQIHVVDKSSLLPPVDPSVVLSAPAL